MYRISKKKNKRDKHEVHLETCEHKPMSHYVTMSGINPEGEVFSLDDTNKVFSDELERCEYCIGANKFKLGD